MRWRRLGISLAVALLLHAVLAAVLMLAWRQFVPPNPAGPVMVDLAPPAAQPKAEPTEPTFATTAADAGRAEAAERANIDHPFAELTAKSAAEAVASESTFAARGRGAVPAAADSTENPADAKTASREGEGPAPGPQAPGPQAPGSQVGGAPIDTRNTPSVRPSGKKPPRTLAHTLRPQTPPRRLSALPGNIVINAIGARVEDRVRAAVARANASGSGARNAVGNTMPTPAGNAAAGTTESVVVNAIGMAVHVHPAATPSANGVVGTGVIASTGGRMPGASALNAGAVNGTGLGGVATRAGTIGGAAKSVSGALNGTDFRPRHP